jgi:hypothetical protein
VSDGPQHPAILASDTERESTQAPEAPPVEGAPVLRIKTRGPGGTLHVRNQRERPNRWMKLLGKGDPYA